MTEKRLARTIAPNGEEIRRLRLAKGKTQQEIVSEGGITQRTLQRAERGEPIGSQHIGVIAKLLDVPSEQIVKAAADGKQPKEKENVILLDPVKGRELIEWLQAGIGPHHVRYSFDVDPTFDTSELIAQVIEKCDEFRYRRGQGHSHLKPAVKIRAIGALNDKLDELASRNVGVFASEALFWEPDIEKMEDGETTVWTPKVLRHLFIAFAPVDLFFVKRRSPSLYTQKSAYESCAKHNLDTGITPSALEEEAFLDGEFLSFYRACWDAAQVAKPKDANVIALVTRD